MDTIEVYASAKLNLSLDVLGRIEGGYHAMKMVMQTVSLRDTVHLRLTDGFAEADFEKRFGESCDDLFGDIIDKYCRMELMERSDGRIRLTEAGLDVANTIMADFI